MYRVDPLDDFIVFMHSHLIIRPVHSSHMVNSPFPPSDVPRKELEAVRALVKEAMEQACSLKVPLVVDMGEGISWLEAH